MNTYFLQDVGSNFSGDLVIDSKGDLKLFDSYETQKSLTNFWLRTDQGEYVPNPSVGCNLGSFIGEINSPKNLGLIESQTYNTLIRNIWQPEDIRIRVVPLDKEEVMIALQLRGKFANISGNFLNIIPEVIAYSFPYITANPTPLIE